MAWIPDDVIATTRGSYQLGIFLRVDTDPALHIWFGVNDMPARMDSIDADGTVYMGGGRLLGIPTLESLINGTADSVDFSMSGIDPATAAKAIDSLPAVRGAAIQIGITTLDDCYQPMGSVKPIWIGTASHVSESSEVAAGDSSPSLTLSLSAVSGSVSRSRPAKTLWSDAQQKALSPTDDFCKQVQRLSRGLAPVWPNY
ncbi:MAG TPA: hypothetical protein VGC14_02075 [Rhizobium sp.]